MKTHGRLLRGSPLLLLPALVLTVGPALAQTAPNNATPAQLAKYDTNKNGRLDPDELTVMRADEAKAAAAVTTTSSAQDEAVQLTPFEVKEDTNGYYAANTMSGTRLNAKIEDLASSISVVTKAQMQDFAMLDINDVFNYEASTEGTGNFSSFEVDRNGMVSDGIQANPQGSNRIRGMGPANIAIDNFATSGRVPVDPIMIDALEISRGPNSNIFGLGQGSGTVNMVGAMASLNREATSATLRFDDIGAYRTSLDINRPLIKGKLAARASAVYQHDAYRQKPSGSTTRRYNFMVRAQPFKNTTVRASFQHYEFYGTRASAITPRDTVSYWKSLGSPTWDPIANAVTVNGVTTVLTGTTNPTGLGGVAFSDPALFVADGGIKLWMISRMPAATATNGPNNMGGTARLLETIAPPVRTGHPLFSTVPGISDRSIFNYADINLAGANKQTDRSDMTTIQVEQYILNNGTHTLALQAGWNREDDDRISVNTVGAASATGNSNYLYIDVNSKLLDGRNNPYFLRPYLGVGEPVHSSNPYERDTYRGQGVYALDLTKKDNWTKWFGRNQVVGYMEERLTKTKSFRFRDANIVDNPIYAPAGQPKANQSGTVAPISTRGYFRYYVGDNQGSNIDYAPSPIAYGPQTFNWFNPLTNAWVADQANLQEAAIQEGAGGGSASQNMIKTRGAVVQDSLLANRIVFTWGKRHDENYTKFGRPSVLKSNGYEYDYAAMNGWVPDNNLSDGDGVWAKRTGDTTTKGVVARPFRSWKAIDAAAARGGLEGFGAQLLSGLNLYYNEATSFLPETPATSVTLEELANPSSKGKDYGFSVSLWDNKVVFKANRYNVAQVGTRNGQFGTFGQRVLRMDIANFAGNNDATALQRQARNWTRALNPGFSDQQVEAAVYNIMQIPADQVAYYNNNNIGETQDATSKGDEIELNLNLDRYWTVKANATRTEAIDANVAPHIPAWIAVRLPIWESIIDPRTGVKWLDQGYNGDNPQTGSGTPRAFLQNNVVSPINLARAVQGKNRNQIREWRFNTSASLKLAKYSENRWLKNATIGGSARWEAPATIGYYGIPVNGDIQAATDYDPDRPVKDKAHWYFDAFVSYNTRLFKDKVRARFQLNVRNIQESRAHLQPIGAYPNGVAHTFRVIDPRTFIFSSSFDL